MLVFRNFSLWTLNVYGSQLLWVLSTLKLECCCIIFLAAGITGTMIRLTLYLDSMPRPPLTQLSVSKGNVCCLDSSWPEAENHTKAHMLQQLFYCIVDLIDNHACAIIGINLNHESRIPSIIRSIQAFLSLFLFWVLNKCFDVCCFQRDFFSTKLAK